MEPIDRDPLRRLGERRDWWDVTAAQRTDGGWDVVLRIDGAYLYREDAEASAERFAWQLRQPIPEHRRASRNDTNPYPRNPPRSS